MAGWFGVILGSAAWATMNRCTTWNQSIQANVCLPFYNWWYGVTAQDLRTEQMTKELHVRRLRMALQKNRTGVVADCQHLHVPIPPTVVLQMKTLIRQLDQAEKAL
jgi:hypothetical protein